MQVQSTMQEPEVTGTYYWLDRVGRGLVRYLKFLSHFSIGEVPINMLSTGGSEPNEGNAEQVLLCKIQLLMYSWKNSRHFV